MVFGLRTRAPSVDRRRAEASWAAETMNGRPSGTDATARLTPACRFCCIGSPRTAPAPTTAAAEASASGVVTFVMPERRVSTPATGALARAAAVERPTSVDEPVATTTARPRPVATVVPS